MYMAVGHKLLVSVIGRTNSQEGVELPESVPDENQRPKWPSVLVLQILFRYHNCSRNFFATVTFKNIIVYKVCYICGTQGGIWG